MRDFLKKFPKNKLLTLPRDGNDLSLGPYFKFKFLKPNPADGKGCYLHTIYEIIWQDQRWPDFFSPQHMAAQVFQQKEVIYEWLQTMFGH